MILFSLFSNSFFSCSNSSWSSVMWFSTSANSSLCFCTIVSNFFSLLFNSFLSLFACDTSSFNFSISDIFISSSSLVVCCDFVAFCNRSFRLEMFFCWAIISSWSCWCPPLSFSHSPIALVRLLLSSVDFFSKCSLSALSSCIWLFFCSISFFVASKWIFCSTHCLLSFSISFLLASALTVVSSNWLWTTILSLRSFSYFSSSSDNFRLTSKTSSRRFFLSLSHWSEVTFKSSSCLCDLESSNWVSRQSWRDILISCSSLEIFVLLLEISFSRTACRSLLCSNMSFKCCSWAESSLLISLSSLSLTRTSKVVSYWLSLLFKELISSWDDFSFDSVDSW